MASADHRNLDPGQTETTLAETLLVDLLGLPAQERPAKLLEFCRQHPEHAAQLRRLFDDLCRMGLVEGMGGTLEGFPERLGGFRLLEQLGGGGMGVVYLAEEEALSRKVALKLIRPEHLYFPGARERFRREARAIASLKHPGIVPVYAVGEEQGIPYFAMEWIEGRTLAEVLRGFQEEKRMPEDLCGNDLARALEREGQQEQGSAAVRGDPIFSGNWVQTCLRLVAAVATALAHAHGKGVIHRDVKPSNIMLGTEGRVMLLDFGLAQSQDLSRVTRTGSQPGSLPYMSPEQVRGEAKLVDAQSDVYSLGVTLHELLTLELPYAAEQAERTRQLILAGRPPSIRQANRVVMSEVEVVCQAAMALEREDRYASAEAFCQDLENALELRPIHILPPGPWLRLRRYLQRHPASSTAILLALLLVLGTPSVLLIQQQSANAAIREEKDAAVAQGQRAERLLKLAMNSVDEMMVRVGSERLKHVPGFEQERLAILREALPIYEQILADSAGQYSAVLSRESARIDYAHLLMGLGRMEEAEPLLRENLRLLQGAPGDTQNQEVRRLKMNCFISLASLDEQRGHLQEAAQGYREGLSLAKSTDTVPGWRVQELRWRLGLAEEKLGHFGAALEAYQSSLAGYQRLLEQEPESRVCRAGAAKARRLLGGVQTPLMQREEAEKNLRQASQDLEKLVVEEPYRRDFLADLVSTLEALARLLNLQARNKEAEPLYRRALALGEDLARKFPGSTVNRNMRLQAQVHLAILLNQLGRPSEAEPLLVEAAQAGGVEETKAKPHFGRLLSMARMELGRMLYERKPEQAIARFRESLAIAKAIGEGAPGYRLHLPTLATIYQNLAIALWGKGQREEAVVCFRQAVGAFSGAIEHNPKRSDMRFLRARNRRYLARRLTDLGRPQEGLGFLRAAHADLSQALAKGLGNAQLLVIDQNVARELTMALLAQGQPQEACRVVEGSLPGFKTWLASLTNSTDVLRTHHVLSLAKQLTDKGKNGVQEVQEGQDKSLPLRLGRILVELMKVIIREEEQGRLAAEQRAQLLGQYSKTFAVVVGLAAKGDKQVEDLREEAAGLLPPELSKRLHSQNR